jgi:hypothetical protein
MVQVFQNLERLLHDGVALVPLDVRDKTHATGIVFMLGAVQTQLLGKLQFGGATHGKPLSSKNRTAEHKPSQQQCQTN